MPEIVLAVDRASVRTYDKFGRLHVALTPISKAVVNEYFGREIPHAERLGLKADQKYALLRHPDELRQGAETSNNIPIMDLHIAQTANVPNQDKVVGSTGTDAVFDPPYLKNSLVFWTQDAINDVNSEKKRQLSCSYSYDPDMTPGTYEGIHYDGVMRNIKFNHVAIVPEGRAGPDVLVEDRMPRDALSTEERHELDADQFAVPGKRKLPIENAKHVREAWDLLDDTDGLTAEEKTEAKRRILAAAKKFDVDTTDWHAHDSLPTEMRNTRMKLSHRALIAQGALAGWLMPKLAADQKLPDLKPVLLGTTAANWKQAQSTIVTRLNAAMQGRLAADASIAGAGAFLSGLAFDQMEPNEEESEEEQTGDESDDPDVRHRTAESTRDKKARDKRARDKKARDSLENERMRQHGEQEIGSFDEEPESEEDMEKRHRKEAKDAKAARDRGEACDESEEDMGKRHEKEARDAKAARDRRAKDMARARDAAEKERERERAEDRAANDAAIAAAIAANEQKHRDLRDAENFVRPWIGELAMAQDSAEAVYRLALDSLGVDVKGVHPSALRAILAAQPKPGSRPAVRERLAADSASDGFAKRFPSVAAVRRL